MTVRIERPTEVQQTARVKQASGLFDLPPARKSEQVWDVDLSGLPHEWHVGVIVGPSGAGKTTVTTELFGKELVAGWPWPVDKSILDGFPVGMSIKDITGLLSSVGFSSPPAWLRPFHVLSNGQQFRVNLARTLAEKPGLAVVDEFTSVVDRTVAQIGSAAVAKTVRRRGGEVRGRYVPL
jgi:ABC-type glutathione transport system ATPase component